MIDERRNRALGDLGERELLRSVLPRFASGIGDDCAEIDLPCGKLVVTTDPVPPTAAAFLAGDSDPFWVGWLLVTINASDLAAAGAEPRVFLAAVECEPGLGLDHFERMLEGISAACSNTGLRYAGGNLREAKRLSAVGVAVGFCENYSPLTRRGAADGDLLVSIGQGGVFWRDALRILSHQSIKIDRSRSPVYWPRSQISFVHEFAKRGLLKSAMDNSDGLLPCLAELSEKNHLGACLDLDALSVPDLLAEERANAARMWLGWGDWNVIGCVSPSRKDSAISLGAQLGVPVHVIGLMTSRHRGVIVQRGGLAAPAPLIESERFTSASWMSSGIKTYVDTLLSAPIP
jgi:thiamine-monophosphate kinase